MKSEKIYLEYLLLKIQAGERLSTEQQLGDELFATLESKVRAFVLKILGPSDAVDDCVQTILLRVFSKLGQLRQVKAFHTWLYRVAYSCCMDHCRKQVPAGAESTATGDLSNFEQVLDVKTAIAQLPEQQQVIVFLFYYEGFTVAEMATILKQPPGTIKYALFVARDRLKQQLTQTD